MVRRRADEVRAERDVRRAHALIGRLRGLSAAESIAVLHDHAALTGVSVHTAALAVIAEWHPTQDRHRRTPRAHGSATADGLGRVMIRWQSREKAHLSVSGACSEDLALRLRGAVDRALRGGATHVTVDTRRTTGTAPEFDDALVWACRRLWSRRGVLVIRARTVRDPVLGSR
jgi:hypothetical protein